MTKPKIETMAQAWDYIAHYARRHGATEWFKPNGVYLWKDDGLHWFAGSVREAVERIDREAA